MPWSSVQSVISWLGGFFLDICNIPIIANRLTFGGLCAGIIALPLSVKMLNALFFGFFGSSSSDGSSKGGK